MSNHLIKQLDREVESLQKALFFQVNVRDEIVDWLRGELAHNEPVLNGEVVLTDGTHDIHVGRSECAESLLSMINKWENNNE
jgi:hypothetical protein|tara:strand:+ start:543 stop:788 length:246 start_codon:yes stop_codon:yes gene_type:complete